MNERIKQLAEQASVSSLWMSGTDQQGNPILEKFAELIVQECIGVLNKRFMGDLNREDMEVRQCIADVKKHFGVEE